MSTVIRNATHYATGKPVDVAFADGVITHVGTATGSFAETIDAAGLTILPGLIDPHVHLREPGANHKEDWDTGSRAAARGGFTTVLDMPNTEPPLTTEAHFRERLQLAAKSVVDFGFHFALTEENIDELEHLVIARTVKLFLGRSTGNLFVTQELLDDAFVRLPHVLFLIHTEWGPCIDALAKQDVDRADPSVHSTLRDRRCAIEAMERVLELVRTHTRPVYFCHVSTAEEVDLIRQAKAEGLPVFAEVTPHHLFLDESAYASLGMLAKVNPPLRTAHDRAVLVAALQEGVIDVIGTDHAPHLRSEKQTDYDHAPAGIPGLETSLPLMLQLVHDGTLSLARVVELMAERPAEIFDLKHKGSLEPGADADLTLVDLTRERRICHSDLVTKCNWSPWHGATFRGVPVQTFVRGSRVFDNESFHPHHGKEVLSHA